VISDLIAGWPTGLHFVDPLWLALLPLAWWAAWRSRTGAQRRVGRVVLVHPDAERFGPRAQRAPGAGRWWLVGLAGSLLLAALARPQSIGGWITPPPLGRQLVMLVDVSQSMSISDFRFQGQRVQRIDVLKGVVTRFVRARRADRFALITFASHAATLVPMTADRTLVEAMLQRLHVGVIGDDTAIGDALVLALKQVREHRSSSARPGVSGGDERRPRPALILFSDGDNTAGQVRPRDAVAIARRLGVAIYTVAIGGDAQPRAADAKDSSRAMGLREIARRTGGRYYRGGNPRALQSIMADIDRLERTERPPATQRRVTEWYVWPLGAGAALFLLAALPFEPRAGRRGRRATGPGRSGRGAA